MRDIKDYEGLYAITSCGRVWSYRTKKFLKPGDNGNGYKFVSLCKGGKAKLYLIHRLVAEAYLPNPNNLPQVSHLDETRDNNCVNNLCWSSIKDNCNTPLHKQRIKETRKRNPVKCLETKEIFSSLTEAAKIKNTSSGSIRYCCLGERKTAGGYHWAYHYEDEE